MWSIELEYLSIPPIPSFRYHITRYTISIDRCGMIAIDVSYSLSHVSRSLARRGIPILRYYPDRPQRGRKKKKRDGMYELEASAVFRRWAMDEWDILRCFFDDIAGWADFFPFFNLALRYRMIVGAINGKDWAT